MLESVVEVSSNPYLQFQLLYILFSLVCTNGDIRLVGGSSPIEGRVEVCANNNWGTVCDNSWENTDAQVACRQAGFAFEGALAFSGALYGSGNGSIILDVVSCLGNESRLVDCPSNPNMNCNHSQDASVLCQPCEYNYYSILAVVLVPNMYMCSISGIQVILV